MLESDLTELIIALRRSIASLADGRVWLYVLTPALIAVVVMVGLSLALLDELARLLIEQPPLDWLVSWGALAVAKLLALLGGWLALLSATYVLSVLLTALIVLPLLLAHLAARDYADLARLGSDSLAGSIWNSGMAALLFVAGWLVTLPLWLIPGLGLFLPLFWMAWLNRRTFAYDVLAAHASDDEWRELRQRHALPLFVLGLLMAALVHVPFLGLLAPSLTALAYVHYGLEALRRLRGGAVVSVQQS